MAVLEDMVRRAWHHDEAESATSFCGGNVGTAGLSDDRANVLGMAVILTISLDIRKRIDPDAQVWLRQCRGYQQDNCLTGNSGKHACFPPSKAAGCCSVDRGSTVCSVFWMLPAQANSSAVAMVKALPHRLYVAELPTVPMALTRPAACVVIVTACAKVRRKQTPTVDCRCGDGVCDDATEYISSDSTV